MCLDSVVVSMEDKGGEGEKGHVNAGLVGVLVLRGWPFINEGPSDDSRKVGGSEKVVWQSASTFEDLFIIFAPWGLHCAGVERSIKSL